MAQDHEEFDCMLLVIAAQRIMDVVAHHVPDYLRAVRLFEKVAADRGDRDLLVRARAPLWP